MMQEDKAWRWGCGESRVSITDRTRKILWGRSGNLCADCRKVLVEDATEFSDASVVGDECHMIGEKPGAARGHLGVTRDELDDYDNLVLLCKIHHKLVDDQPETYTLDTLRAMKTAHESWVKETLARKPADKQAHFALLVRIQTGRHLSGLIERAVGFALDHDEAQTEEETKLIGSFLQSIKDWGNIWSDLETSQQVEASFSLAKEIREMEAAGFLIFGTCEKRKMRFLGKVESRLVALITVARSTNIGITKLGDLAVLIMD
jgi:hypothetical protein